MKLNLHGDIYLDVYIFPVCFWCELHIQANTSKWMNSSWVAGQVVCIHSQPTQETWLEENQPLVITRRLAWWALCAVPFLRLSCSGFCPMSTGALMCVYCRGGERGAKAGREVSLLQGKGLCSVPPPCPASRPVKSPCRHPYRRQRTPPCDTAWRGNPGTVHSGKGGTSIGGGVVVVGWTRHCQL